MILDDQQKGEGFDGSFNNPLSDDILNYPIPPKYKTPNINGFNGEGDLRQLLINFIEECLLKLGSEEKMMVTFSPRILKDDVSEWFYKLYSR